jgi:hypothetical protein
LAKSLNLGLGLLGPGGFDLGPGGFDLGPLSWCRQ